MFESLINYFFKEINKNFEPYKKIKTFDNVLTELQYDKKDFKSLLNKIYKYSRSNVNLIKFNTIKKCFSKYNRLYFDHNENKIYGLKILILTESEVIQEKVDINSNFIKICEIQSTLKYYYVYGIIDDFEHINGIGGFFKSINVTYNDLSYSIISFNSRELGEHFIKYFGIYIIKALYSNIKNIKIINK